MKFTRNAANRRWTMRSGKLDEPARAVGGVEPWRPMSKIEKTNLVCMFTVLGNWRIREIFCQFEKKTIWN